MSRKEGICGIVNCFNKPAKRGKKCTNFYCQDHFPSHLDLLPDNVNLDYDSSNEGLELFMDDEEPAEPEPSSSKKGLDAYIGLTVKSKFKLTAANDPITQIDPGGTQATEVTPKKSEEHEDPPG